MREPVFTETGQIGMVVRDLQATVKRYTDDYGIGPWTFFEVKPEEATELREMGEPLRGGYLCATTKVGSVWWELTQPLNSESLLGRFLAEKGEGVHHIAVVTPDYDGAVAMQTEPLPLTGSFMGIDVSYLPTQDKLGITLEVFKGFDV